MNSKGWILAAALLAACTAQATCYTVHKADGTLVVETSSTPVNLVFALGDTVPEKFGHGAFMVISDQDAFCKERRAEQQVLAAPAPLKRAAVPKAKVADEHQATDEELLALKPDEVAAREPVQSVEVKVVGMAETPAGEAVKAHRQMVAGGAAGKIAERVE
jgi:hypothetical protein